MEAVLWELIGDFLITIAQSLIIYNLCEETLELKNEKYSAFYYLISPAAVYFGGKILSIPALSGYSLVMNAVLLAVHYICIMIFLKGNFFKRLFILLVGWVLSVLPQMIITFIVLFGFDYSMDIFTEQWSPLWFFFVAIVLPIQYFTTRLTIAIINKRKPTFPMKQILLLCVYDIFMIVVGILVWPNITKENNSDYGIETATIYFTLSVLLIGAISFVYFLYNKRLTKSKLKLLESENKLKEQRRRMEDIKEQEKQIRKIRHDYKNHITTGLALLRDGKVEEANKYFSEYLDSQLTVSQQYVNTDYEAVNAVVNKKLGICFEKGIEVSTAMSWTLDKVSEMDLCVVLFNLLDNAIEECQKIDVDKDKKINIEMYQNKSYLTVKIQNSVKENVIENNPELKTTKSDKDNHGVGLQIVREVADKYNGIVDIEESSGLFCTEVWLQNF